MHYLGVYSGLEEKVADKVGVKQPTPQQKPFTIEFLGTMAIITALMIFMYASTFQPETINLLTSGVLLLVIGLTFGVLMVGVALKPFSFDRFLESLIWSCLAFAIIYFVNRNVPFTLGVQVLNARWYAVLMGVAEESFFRVFLTGFLWRITHSNFFAIVIGSFVWTIYHMARYGGDMGALFIVLISGFALGWVFLTSKMADPVIFAHGLVNFVAMGGSIPFVQGSSGGGQLQAGLLPDITDWAGLGLWGLIVTIGVIAMAGIINHLTRKSYQRSPRGRTPKATRKSLPRGQKRKAQRKTLPSGNPKNKKLRSTGDSKTKHKPKGPPKVRQHKLKGSPTAKRGPRGKR